MALKDVLVARGVFTVKGRLIQIGHVIHEAEEYAEALLFHHHAVTKAKHEIAEVAAEVAPAVEAAVAAAEDHHE